MIVQKLFDGKKRFIQQDIVLDVAIVEHQSNYTHTDRGRTFQPYIEIRASSDQTISIKRVSARKVFKRIGASEAEVTTKDDREHLRRRGREFDKDETKDDLDKQRLLDSSDFAKELAAKYLYNRLSLVVDPSDVTKFSVELSPLASDLMDGSKSFDLDLDDDQQHGMSASASSASYHDSLTTYRQSSLSPKRPAEMVRRRPSSSPTKRRPQQNQNYHQYPHQRSQHCNTTAPTDAGLVYGTGTGSHGRPVRCKVHDYPFHQFTKWKEGSGCLPSTPKAPLMRRDFDVHSDQLHRELCQALKHTRQGLQGINKADDTDSNPETGDQCTPHMSSSINSSRCSTGGFGFDLSLSLSRSPHGPRHLTSIEDSLPKDEPILTPRTRLRRQRLLDGSQVYLHSAFRSGDSQGISQSPMESPASSPRLDPFPRTNTASQVQSHNLAHTALTNPHTAHTPQTPQTPVTHHTPHTPHNARTNIINLTNLSPKNQKIATWKGRRLALERPLHPPTKSVTEPFLPLSVPLSRRPAHGLSAAALAPHHALKVVSRLSRGEAAQRQRGDARLLAMASQALLYQCSPRSAGSGSGSGTSVNASASTRPSQIISASTTAGAGAGVGTGSIRSSTISVKRSVNGNDIDNDTDSSPASRD